MKPIFLPLRWRMQHLLHNYCSFYAKKICLMDCYSEAESPKFRDQKIDIFQFWCPKSSHYPNMTECYMWRTKIRKWIVNFRRFKIFFNNTGNRQNRQPKTFASVFNWKVFSSKHFFENFSRWRCNKNETIFVFIFMLSSSWRKKFESWTKLWVLLLIIW